jgi:class 3 adenylate cyclase/tetratricopeptide (TPR) repeat protein
MQGIVEWLALIGLSQYADAFVEHGIDLDLARELTSDDLKDLGIRRLADRKVFLREIAHLAGAASVSQVHRRILSVLFCDLVGSTELAHEVDAEEYRTALKAYLETSRRSITRYGGFVAMLFGDGVLAYFGWPYAGEDQASQAVRAGLEVAAAVQRLRFENDVVPHCRVGIATGRVVIGGDSGVDNAFGETVNLAARLQSIAEPDRVVIDHATCRAIGNGFDTNPLPAANLKGFSDPVDTWEVAAERRYVDRFAARRLRASAFIGRHAETTALSRLWESVLAGAGHTVVIRADAGLGKSRLVREFRDTITTQHVTVLNYQCNEHHANSAFYPVIQNLEQAAGMDVHDAPDARRRKLTELFGDAGDENAEDLEAVAQLLLSVPGLNGAAPSAVSATQRREQTIAFLVDHTLRMSGERPLLVVVEDVHWIDPSSFELLRALVSRTEGSRAMVVVTTRPVVGSLTTWAGATEIPLPRLTDSDIETIVRSVDASSQLSDAEVAAIVSRADGIPLFAEELTASAIEHGRARTAYDLPETVEASLTARLDFLGEAKHVAQMGAVLGREFAYRELIALAGSTMAGSTLDAGLAAIVTSGLLLQSEQAGEARYRFRHALVQGVAYGSLLRKARRRLHERVAREVLTETTRARAPELMAHHLTEAGLIDEAIGYWKAAGARAAEKSANAEAISHFTRGLELADRLPPGGSRDAVAFSFLVGMCGPLIAQHGYTSDEVAECVSNALSLSGNVGHAPEMYTLLYARWAALLTSGSIAASLQVARDFSELAQRQYDQDAMFARHRMLGASYMCLGELALASHELDQILEGYDPERHARLGTAYGVDLLVAALCFKSEVLWLIGAVEQARASAAAALRAALAVEHVNSTAMALHFCGLIAFLNRDRPAVRAYAEQMREFAARQPVGVWPTLIGAMDGWAAVEDGQVDRGMAMMFRGVDLAVRAGVSMFLPFVYCRVAETLLLQGRLADARAWVAKSTALMDRTGEVNYRGEVLRLQATLLLRQHQPAAAERLLIEAIDIARQQGARSVELRIAATYAEFLAEQGATERGTSMLAAALEGFADVHDFHDVVLARATLAAMGPDAPPTA